MLNPSPLCSNDTQVFLHADEAEEDANSVTHIDPYSYKHTHEAYLIVKTYLDSVEMRHSWIHSTNSSNYTNLMLFYSVFSVLSTVDQDVWFRLVRLLLDQIRCHTWKWPLRSTFLVQMISINPSLTNMCSCHLWRLKANDSRLAETNDFKFIIIDEVCPRASHRSSLTFLSTLIIHVLIDCDFKSLVCAVVQSRAVMLHRGVTWEVCMGSCVVQRQRGATFAKMRDSNNEANETKQALYTSKQRLCISILTLSSAPWKNHPQTWINNGILITLD